VTPIDLNDLRNEEQYSQAGDDDPEIVERQQQYLQIEHPLQHTERTHRLLSPSVPNQVWRSARFFRPP
jgi:hypothetical protein